MTHNSTNLAGITRSARSATTIGRISRKDKITRPAPTETTVKHSPDSASMRPTRAAERASKLVGHRSAHKDEDSRNSAGSSGEDNARAKSHKDHGGHKSAKKRQLNKLSRQVPSRADRMKVWSTRYTLLANALLACQTALINAQITRIKKGTCIEMNEQLRPLEKEYEQRIAVAKEKFAARKLQADREWHAARTFAQYNYAKGRADLRSSIRETLSSQVFQVRREFVALNANLLEVDSERNYIAEGLPQVKKLVSFPEPLSQVEIDEDYHHMKYGPAFGLAKSNAATTLSTTKLPISTVANGIVLPGPSDMPNRVNFDLDDSAAYRHSNETSTAVVSGGGHSIPMLKTSGDMLPPSNRKAKRNKINHHNGQHDHPFVDRPLPSANGMEPNARVSTKLLHPAMVKSTNIVHPPPPRNQQALAPRPPILPGPPAQQDLPEPLHLHFSDRNRWPSPRNNSSSQPVPFLHPSLPPDHGRRRHEPANVFYSQSQPIGSFNPPSFSENPIRPNDYAHAASHNAPPFQPQYHAEQLPILPYMRARAQSLNAPTPYMNGMSPMAPSSTANGFASQQVPTPAGQHDHPFRRRQSDDTNSNSAFPSQKPDSSRQYSQRQSM